MFLDRSFFGWITKIIEEYYMQILYGTLRTLLLALVGTIVGLIVASIFAYIRTKKIESYESKFKQILFYVLKAIVNVYVTIIRGTPMMVQAIIFYYGLKTIGINWDPLAAGLFTISINTIAYLTEVLRGGIESIDKGQLEASLSIGLSYFKSYVLIIFPQALKNSMASIGNEFIVNIKDSSVLNVIGVIELYNATSMAGNKYFAVVEGMMIAAVIYLFLTYTSSFILKKFEKRLGSPVKEIVSSN